MPIEGIARRVISGMYQMNDMPEVTLYVDVTVDIFL